MSVAASSLYRASFVYSNPQYSQQLVIDFLIQEPRPLFLAPVWSRYITTSNSSESFTRMDPVSAVGVAAGAAQLAGQAKDIVCNMWQYFEAVKNAPKRSQELRQEMSNLADLLESLEDVLNSPTSSPLFTNSDPVEEFVEMLDTLTARVAAPKSKGIRRLKWPFTQEENKRLLSKMERYKSTFNLALNVQSA
jgi:Fungal N-terminal domain of STAND proteins